MNVKVILLAVLMLSSLFSFLSCSPPPPEKKTEPVKTDKLVARVASIHKEEGYALIQRYGRLKFGENMILYTLSADGKTASLKVTGERLGQYVAVDIVSGDLNIGDAVYLRDLADEDQLDSNEHDNKQKS